MINMFQNAILDWLAGTMPTPIPYMTFDKSWFHYLALVIVMLAAWIATNYLRNASPKRVKFFLLGAGIILTGFEIYKQIIMNYVEPGGYLWYIFPFQFCSTPIYITLLASFLKPGKVQTALYEFLATYGLFAGLSVMLYPNSVFINLIGINIQTMVHHGTMLVVGIAMLVSVIKIERKTFLRASLIFTILLVIAMGLNFIHNTWIGNATFNMFFINQRYGNHLPILSNIFAIAPYPVFLMAYVLGFGLCAAVMETLGYVIRKISYSKVPISARNPSNI